jgi:preprotein translocase subunit SecA
VSIFDKLLRAGEGRALRRLKAISDAVNSIEENYADLTDAELRELTDQYKERYADGESLDDLLPEAFATAREAANRVLGQRHYDVQVQGGAALHFGNIAEMKTGEGKTLTCVLPAYLNALAGKGVHVVTVNDYLARRDAEWMGQVHQLLGLSVGVILPNRPSIEHKAAYGADITYGTNNEFGFDYLRDNMTVNVEDLVQRGHFFAIVDEVDSILIDEARTPLIISGPAEQSARWYSEFARVVERLTAGEGEDYEVDLSKRTVAVTERGVTRVEDRLGIDNLYESLNTPLVGYLNNALKAKELFKRDKDYIVHDGEVLIVDEFTGRILYGRRYNEGMHQAIEAKEGVEIKQENQTLATITLQNYFRLYDKLSGMTGTAQTEAAEFNKVYNVGVVTIPTHRPMIRNDRSDVIYKSEKAKFNAVVEDIVERHQKGQPVLVGTVSVENSEILSQMLRRRGIAHSVLNAKYHAKEAEIVAQAGRRGGVTVATNMAGRGTDILLGGNPEFLAAAELRNRGLDPAEQPEEYEAALIDAIPRWKKQCDEEAEDVIEAGGLYVLGTERHDARRIDNQLRGRSGRQGDPGESRFYLSLQDELMKRFRATAVEALMDRLSIPEDVPIESKLVTRQIKSAQTQIEAQNAEIRKDVLKYDEVLNKQRQVIYAERHRVLDGEDLHDQVNHMIDDVVTAYVDGATSAGYAEDWDLDQLWSGLKLLYPVGVTIEDLEEEAGSRQAMDHDFLKARLIEDAHAAYETREEQLGSDVVRQMERGVLLEVIDRKWREHLYEMDYLKDGVGLRAYAQRDPLVEYQREGFDMFNQMLDGVKEEAVGFLFNIQIQYADEPEISGVGEAPVQLRQAPSISASAQRAQQQLLYSAPSIDGEAGSGAVAMQDAPALGIGSASGNGARRGPRPNGRTGARPAATGTRTGSTATKTDADGGPTPPSTAASGARRVSLGSASGIGSAPGGSSPGAQAANRQAAPGQVVGGSGPSRNGPCPCGSGKKYKRCHGAPGA